MLRKFGPLAHQVEHHTFNVVVAGSSPARLTRLVSATVAILWLSFPIEVRVVREGAKKAYLKFNKVFSLEVEPNRKEIESEKLSLV